MRRYQRSRGSSSSSNHSMRHQSSRDPGESKAFVGMWWCHRRGRAPGGTRAKSRNCKNIHYERRQHDSGNLDEERERSSRIRPASQVNLSHRISHSDIPLSPLSPHSQLFSSSLAHRGTDLPPSSGWRRRQGWRLSFSPINRVVPVDQNRRWSRSTRSRIGGRKEATSSTLEKT